MAFIELGLDGFYIELGGGWVFIEGGGWVTKYLRALGRGRCPEDKFWLASNLSPSLFAFRNLRIIFLLPINLKPEGKFLFAMN